MVFVHRKIDTVPIDKFTHFEDQRVLCVENRIAPTRDRPWYDRFHPCKVLECIYILQPKMVRGNIRNDTNIAMIKTQTRTNDATAGRFQDCYLYCWIF